MSADTRVKGGYQGVSFLGGPILGVGACSLFSTTAILSVAVVVHVRKRVLRLSVKYIKA